MKNNIFKINTYYGSGIEIQEKELVSGSYDNLKKYTAIVNVRVNTPAGEFDQQISSEFDAIDVVDAFGKAKSELNVKIEEFKKEAEAAAKKAIDEQFGPRIITPD